jgi:endonuclease YncB( thermonuclease family)
MRALVVIHALCIAVSTAALEAGALASEIIGIPRIVDGDTVQIGTTNIRLEGIDAPEADQLCLDREGKRWTCGIEARDRLIQKAGGKIWTCHINSIDRYGRSLATCEVEGANINRWLVLEGWAMSFARYSHVYDVDEHGARQAQVGLWSGAFIAPWDWRGRNIKTEILGAVSVLVHPIVCCVGGYVSDAGVRNQGEHVTKRRMHLSCSRRALL